MPVEMRPVDSSAIASIGFEQDSGELHVLFHSGRTYAYEDVPESTFQEFLAADSKGSYLNREIKPNFACHEL